MYGMGYPGFSLEGVLDEEKKGSTSEVGTFDWERFRLFLRWQILTFAREHF